MITIDTIHISGCFTYQDDWTWEQKRPDNLSSYVYKYVHLQNVKRLQIVAVLIHMFSEGAQHLYT